MKNIFRLFVLLLSIVVFSGCADDDNFDSITPQNYAQEDVSVIKALGLDETTLIDMGDHYLVEGDIAILKTNMDGYREKLMDEGVSLRQTRSYNRISVNNVSNLKIKIDPSVSSVWGSAVRQAMEHYNKISSNIWMRESFDNNYDIIIERGERSWAYSDFPSPDGKAGPYVKIHPSADGFNSSQKVFLIVHELGHALGLRHTDYLMQGEDPYEYGAFHIPGTPTGSRSSQDPNSVFNSGYYYGKVMNWNGFSGYDLTALRYLYPISDNKVYFKDIRMTNSGSTSITEANLYVPKSVELTIQADMYLSNSQENPEGVFRCSGGSLIINRNTYGNPSANTKVFLLNAGTYNVTFTLSGLKYNSMTQASISIIGIRQSMGPYSTIGSPSSIGVGDIY